MTELSFNERSGYICHSKSLEEVTFFDGQEQSRSVCSRDQSLPKNVQSFYQQIKVTNGLQYYQKVFDELLKLSVQESGEPCVLVGHQGSGKSLILKSLADQLGYSFSQVDCLAHLNLNQLEKLLSEKIPQQSSLSQVVELQGFDKYSLWYDGPQASQN